MTYITIAVLAIALTVLVYKAKKAEIRDAFNAYVEMVKELFTKDALLEFKQDMVKSCKDLYKSFKLPVFWLLVVPVTVVLGPLIIAGLALCTSLTRK